MWVGHVRTGDQTCLCLWEVSGWGAAGRRGGRIVCRPCGGGGGEVAEGHRPWDRKVAIQTSNLH